MTNDLNHIKLKNDGGYETIEEKFKITLDGVVVEINKDTYNELKTLLNIK